MIFVRLSVCLSGTSVYNDHTVHVSAVSFKLLNFSVNRFIDLLTAKKKKQFSFNAWYQMSV